MRYDIDSGVGVQMSYACLSPSKAYCYVYGHMHMSHWAEAEAVCNRIAVMKKNLAEAGGRTPELYVYIAGTSMHPSARHLNQNQSPLMELARTLPYTFATLRLISMTRQTGTVLDKLSHAHALVQGQMIKSY
jgi:hypothetical protein